MLIWMIWTTENLKNFRIKYSKILNKANFCLICKFSDSQSNKANFSRKSETVLDYQKAVFYNAFHCFGTSWKPTSNFSEKVELSRIL